MEDFSCLYHLAVGFAFGIGTALAVGFAVGIGTAPDLETVLRAYGGVTVAAVVTAAAAAAAQ